MANRKRRGRGEGSVFYDESKERWVGTMERPPGPGGKRRRRKVTAETKWQAQEKLRKLQKQADDGQLTDAGALTLEQYLRRWLATTKGKVATHTYLPYERDCNLYLIPHAGRVPLAKVTALHVEKLYADLAAAGVSPAMQRKAGVTLSAALSAAVKLRLVMHNVAKDVKKPRHVPKDIRPLDPDQWARFMAAAKEDRLCALYITWVDSCAREGELFALTWADVDFDAGAITVTKEVEEVKGHLSLKEVKTKKSRRRIALSAFTMEALAEHRQRMLAEGNYRPDATVFCDTEGGWLRKSNMQRRSFEVIVERANATAGGADGEPKSPPLPPIRPYDLRHTGATLLLLAGENPKVVSERLGHSTVVLTLNTYSHVLPGMQERAASKMDAIFRAGRKSDGEAGAGHKGAV
jgi:integrase